MKKLVAMILCSVCFLSFSLVSFGEEIVSESNDIELGNTRIVLKDLLIIFLQQIVK